jgi:lipopolysaccharide/colanic/teichoic acid biosynthesis glycosyltransferase
MGGMRFRSPSSRAHVAVRFSLVDVGLAALSPLLALYLRNALILVPFDLEGVAIFVLISLSCSLVGFALFRIYGGIPSYLSVHDLVDLVKAVLVGALLTCVTLFTLTRLDGVPRSVPAIHALILAAGLLLARLFAHIADNNRKLANQPQQGPVENIILIGLSDLSVLFIKFLETIARGRQQVIGLLEGEARWIGRSVSGVPVFGPPAHLESLIDEFAVHGVITDRVVVGSGPDELSPDVLAAIRDSCERRGLDLLFVSDIFGLGGAEPPRGLAPAAAALVRPPQTHATPSAYFRVKRAVEVSLALILIVLLMPLWLFAGVLAFVDVGAPVLFWQRRAGLGGQDFQLYKIRTLKSAFDRTGRSIPEERRLSWIGRLLRQSRLDELPQLLSVIEGSMALVGPRPLLPQDQPPDPSLRQMVRPGITGWAQVNGGTLLSPEEKEALDAWYIAHASFGLDLRIAAMTVYSLVRGERRSERALAEARHEREAGPAWRPDIAPETEATAVGS